MQINTDGVVLRNLNVGESDRILTILTRECGIVRASAKGARNIKNRLSTPTQPLCHSNFTLFRGREKYIINEAEPLNCFMGVRSDLDRLALAQYFAELSASQAPAEDNAEFFLRLLLNALFLIETGKRPLPLVKAAFEMRLLTLSGYMPDLVACRGCGAYESGLMFFAPAEGCLYCGECAQANDLAPAGLVPLSPGALAAFRHTVYADFERLFAFTLHGSGTLGELAQASERYLLFSLERSFTTLEFYRGLAGPGGGLPAGG